MNKRHLLSTKDITKNDVKLIFDNTIQIYNRLLKYKGKQLSLLCNQNIMMMFYENSTRTKVSFELAGKWMGANVININSSKSSVSKGESLRDTVLTLSATGVDALIIRHPSSGVVQQVTEWINRESSNKPSIINAGDGTHEHPTQALIDVLTIFQSLGSIENKRILIVGDILHSRVARSNIFLLNTLGAEIVLVSPSNMLPSEVRKWPVLVSNKLDNEISKADAIIMLRVQSERINGMLFPSPREYALMYGLSKKRQEMLKSEAVILHPGPIIRDMEISSSVAYTPQSAILQQVINGVYLRMALLCYLLLDTNLESIHL